MPYYLRPMRKEDIVQVNEIDREAFPTQWPPPDYRRELQNPLARLIIVGDEDKTVAEPEVKAPNTSGLVSRVRQLFSRERFFGEKASSGNQYVLGFASIWVMADEAHITNIAVRKQYQRQGIGERLLISVIDLAAELKADFITLEVRVSNTIAQSLYHKYGFTKVSARPGYYTDNREDALLMSSESITSASFQARFQQLNRAHSKKCETVNKSWREIPTR
ncbi:MAG: ribosomal-protein-alanine N-acetyltransferase [Dehalococcoidia bacterium]|nr:MAG: ribosomal-protein-alanine N-acetyltransferase [Dehalococcoidia bacterium]